MIMKEEIVEREQFFFYFSNFYFLIFLFLISSEVNMTELRPCRYCNIWQDWIIQELAKQNIKAYRKKRTSEAPDYLIVRINTRQYIFVRVQTWGEFMMVYPHHPTKRFESNTFWYTALNDLLEGIIKVRTQYLNYEI